MVYGSEDLFERLPIHWMWWPMLGGLVIGLGGLIEPHALGVGYDNISALLQSGLASGPALRLLVVKALIWSIALGSGTSGGVLAPLLIMGGVVGTAFGGWISPGDTGIWALLGMSAMMGGTMRAPLTAMMFGLELTHDMQALLPLATALRCSAGHHRLAAQAVYFDRKNRASRSSHCARVRCRPLRSLPGRGSDGASGQGLAREHVCG